MSRYYGLRRVKKFFIFILLSTNSDFFKNPFKQILETWGSHRPLAPPLTWPFRYTRTIIKKASGDSNCKINEIIT